MKNSLIYLVSIFFTLLFFSCRNPMVDMSSLEESAADGQSLTISLNNPDASAARTIFPDLNDVISTYNVSLTSDLSDSITESIPGSQDSVSFTSLTPATYTVLVEALDSDGNKVAEGEADVLVNYGSAASAVIDIVFIDGTGTISLDLTFPSGVIGSIDGVLIDSEGNEEDVTFTVEDTSASLFVEKPSGIYTLLATMKDSAGTMIASVVEAVDVIGSLVSSETIEFSNSDFNSPPSAPSGIEASQEEENLIITWTDNANTETSFEIFRKESESSEWVVLSDAVAVNSESYTDSTVETYKTYQYRVRATNSFGSSAWCTGEEKTVSGFISAVADSLSEEDWNFYAGKSTTIPFSNLIANDENLLNTDPIEIISVQSPVNGTVEISGSSVIFTASSAVGESASFEYTARIEDTDYTGNASVTIESIEEAPSVIAASDGPDGSIYTIQQGSETYINTSVLLSNDTGNGLEFANVVSGSEIGCSVSLSGSNLTVSSTGLAYQPAQFKYKITDELGSEATGTVYLSITALSAVEGYVFKNESSFNSFISEYTPQSFEDVFNSWPRVSGANYYTSASSYTGNAAAWTYLTNDADGDGDDDPRVLQPNNVYPPEGFVCPEDEALESYSFEATLYSNNSDNDSIGLIIAFERDGSVNKYLVAHRTKGGNWPSSGWGISYYEGTNQTVLAEKSVDGVDGGWSGLKSRVKVQRTGDTIKCYASDWNDTGSYNPDSLIEIDLSENTVDDSTSSQDLSVFRGAKQYGYFTYSQPNSTYLDIDLSGGISGDTAILLYDTSGDSDDYEMSSVYKYVSGAWKEQSTTIQEELGYVREVTNPVNSDCFLIKEDEVEIIE